MTMIVIQRTDGLTIRHPNPKDQKPGETEEQFLRRIERQNLSPGERVVGRVENLPNAAVPVWEYENGVAVTKPDTPRRVRNAWVWDGDNVIPDPALENEILMEHLRRVRNMLLEDSDIAIARVALEEKDSVKQDELAAYRQSLRDLPQNTTDPRTAVWPPVPDSVKPRGTLAPSGSD